jgi:hypothetical protein
LTRVWESVGLKVKEWFLHKYAKREETEMPDGNGQIMLSEIQVTPILRNPGAMHRELPHIDTRVPISYGDATRDLMAEVMKTIIQQPDFNGIGGHGLLEDSHHGAHSQIDIRLGNTQIDFRDLQRS